VSGSANVWKELIQSVPPGQVADHCAAFVIWGFEELMDHTGTADWDLVRQFNIQRDLFVRDFPCWWVLLIHPASRQHWLKNAPDFSDFVALWIKAPMRVHDLVGILDQSTSLRSDSSSSSSSASSRRADWPEPLSLALEDIRASRFDNALDRIHSFRADRTSNPQTEYELALANLLESDIIMARGQTSAALHLLRDHAHPALKRLAESDPTNTTWQRDLSMSFERLGDIAVDKGNLPEAQRLFTEALHIRQRLAESDPDNSAWWRDLSVSLIDLGDLATAQGNLAEGKRLNDDALRIAKRLTEFDPANTTWQRDLSVSLNKLGGLAAEQGNLSEAQPLFEESLQIRQRLAESDPPNTVGQRDLSVSLSNLGRLAAEQGNLPEARRLFEKSLQIRQRLADSDPSNTTWQRDLSVSLNKLGGVANEQGNLHMAQQLLSESLQIVQRLVESDPANTTWQRDLSVSLKKLGDLSTNQGNLPEAQRFFGEALRIVQRLAESEPSNTEWQRDLWISYWNFADMLERLESSDAMTYWRKAYDILASMMSSGLFVSPHDQRSFDRLREKLKD
jgi:tetratricopeptide (TPR) repeat protein